VSAYLPTGAEAALAALGTAAAALLLSFAVTRLRAVGPARAAAGGLVLGTLLAMERVTAGEPPGFRMLALIAGLLYAMKAVVSVQSSAREGTRLPLLRWLAFATLWPGMRPALFASLGPRRPGAGRLLARGLARAGLGAALVALARVTESATGSPAVATLALLPGLSLMLHFGAFDVVAGLWRLAGVDCAPLFRAPLRSGSLREFWGRRWNLAFSEMTAIAVYRPLTESAGTRTALLASFLFSGLLHEAAISLPVRAGFGLPFSYFVLHGVLALVERKRGPLGRPATLASLVLPLPLLFHPPFLRGVLWPLLGAP
jgi:alginate O-acetyltransferase complex protein AlgI